MGKLQRIRNYLETLTSVPKRTRKATRVFELSKSDKGPHISERTREIIELLLDTLSMKNMDLHICILIDRIMRMLCINKMYHEDSFDLLANTLKNTSSELVMQHVAPAFLGLCAGVRYYNPSLLNIVGSYVMDNVENLSHTQLTSVVYSMGQLYHHFPALFPKLEKYLLADDVYLNAKHLSWMLVWSGMIHAIYPKDLLALMLQDSYIKGMIT